MLANRKQKDIRAEAFAKVEKYKEADVASGDAIRQVNKKLHQKRKRTPYRSSKTVLRETSCCLDKDRPLPEAFKQCSDCPKLTEAELKANKAVLKQGRGKKKTEAGSKQGRGKSTPR